MAIEYAMLFTTKQECIHIHIIKLMVKRERAKEKPVRRNRSAGLDTEEEKWSNG